ncbi:MAG: hypothetical protein V4525_11750 [Pseudomonadota bacterium]
MHLQLLKNHAIWLKTIGLTGFVCSALLLPHAAFANQKPYSCMYMNIPSLGCGFQQNSPSNPSTTTPPTNSPSGDSKTINNVKTTWYGSAGMCSSANPCYVAYARVNGYPAAFHDKATEGSGTATDPITFAANGVKSGQPFPVGTLIYIPTFKKYFVLEDECPGCAGGGGNALHIDLFQGPSEGGTAESHIACANQMNGFGISIIVNPDKNLPVETTPVLTASGACTGKRF